MVVVHRQRAHALPPQQCDCRVSQLSRDITSSKHRATGIRASCNSNAETKGLVPANAQQYHGCLLIVRRMDLGLGFWIEGCVALEGALILSCIVGIAREEHSVDVQIDEKRGYVLDKSLSSRVVLWRLSRVGRTARFRCPAGIIYSRDCVGILMFRTRTSRITNFEALPDQPQTRNGSGYNVSSTLYLCYP